MAQGWRSERGCGRGDLKVTPNVLKHVLEFYKSDYFQNG